MAKSFRKSLPVSVPPAGKAKAATPKANGHSNGKANLGLHDDLDDAVVLEEAEEFGFADEDATFVEADNDTVDATDDPVRMYLMQMGQIPLLNRAEEIDAARKIEGTRKRFRHCMLATDYVLQGAVELLEKVRDGQLRLDRTIEVSVTNRIWGRLFGYRGRFHVEWPRVEKGQVPPHVLPRRQERRD